MLDACAAELPGADVVVMAAAPADFRPGAVATQKIKKADGVDEVMIADRVEAAR